MCIIAAGYVASSREHDQIQHFVASDLGLLCVGLFLTVLIINMVCYL